MGGVAVRTEMKPLSKPQITRQLSTLPGWTHRRGRLTKRYTFGSFREAISFMVRVAFEAEELNHHPTWENTYRTVTIHLTTHDQDNQVTRKDTDLAKRIEAVAWVD